MKTQRTHFTVPISLAHFVILNKLDKPFAVYLLMKQISDGVINKTAFSFIEIANQLGIKDKRTLYKYLQKSIELKWIGFNVSTGNYFVRSFKSLQLMNGLKSKYGIILELDTLINIKSKLCSGLIAFKLNGLLGSQIKKIKRKVGLSALKKRGALQLAKSVGLRPYLGLSNYQLGECFNCSKSEANRIKLNCIKSGLLTANHKFEFIAKFKKYDPLIKHWITNSSRIRFTRPYKGEIKVYEQITDELIPRVHCKRMR